MTFKSSLVRRIAMPALAAAVVATSLSTASQPAEALGRTGRALVIAGAILGAGALIGAGAARAGGSSCVRETRCVSNGFGERVCRSVSMCN